MNFYIKSLCRPRAGMAKILLVMRLIIVLLTTAILQVSASGYAQKITLSERNAPLEQVLKKIKAQSGYNVVYASESLKEAKKVSLQFNGLALETALEQIFKNQELAYEVKDRTIIIKEKAPSFLDRVVSAFSAIDVRGKVIGENEEVLAGATVKVKGTSKSVSTGSDGAFYLRGVDEDAVIEISFVGFKSVEIKAAKDLGTIKLEVSFSDLNEVEINKGYYTETKKLSTGSVGKVTASEIEKQPVLNPLQALQGRVSGLVITQQSGMPGGNFEVLIRGQNSLRNTRSDNGNRPLYVINGVPYVASTLNIDGISPTTNTISIYAGENPLNNINPADIASIEVLKDADATAIYGSRGANGVILITTKKGQAGDLRITATAQVGKGRVTRKMKLLNTEQYLEMRKEAYKNDAIAIPSTAYDINGTWDENRYTDWQKELIGGSANYTDAQLNFGGGSQNIQYLFGAGYHKETTVFPGDNGIQRLSTNLGLNASSPNQRFKSILSVSLSSGKSDLLGGDLTNTALTLSPNAPALYDESGNLNWENNTFTNPLRFSQQPFENQTYNVLANANLSYRIFDGLDVKANMGFVNAGMTEKKKQFKTFFNPTQAATATLQTMFGNSKINSWVVEPQISYQKIIRNAKFNLLIGSTFQLETKNQVRLTAQGFANEALMDNISAADQTKTTSSFNYYQYRYNAIFGRLGFEWKNKYLFNITARRDGSSRFGPRKQFGNFGAIGVAWIFTNYELLQKTIPWLSFGKIRGSYGITGSDQIGDYGYMDSYTSTGAGQYQQVVGLIPSRLFNPDFHWETNQKIEGALELGFLNDQIYLSTAYFRNHSSNQLVGYPLPPTAGFSTVNYNLNATVRNEGWEFEVRSENVKNKNFHWSSSINMNVPNSKLISYPGLKGSAYANTYIVGEPITIVKRYKYLGVNPSSGLYTVEDVDGNGTFNANDRVVVINDAARFYGGIQNNLVYKSFNLDFLFQFTKQLGINYLNLFNRPGTLSNQPLDVLRRWQNPEDQTDIQKFSNVSSASTAFNNKIGSEAFYSDASFIRLKNLSISYLLKKPFITNRLQQLKIFMQAQNLLTITNYKGLDPENAGSIELPPLRVFTLGLNITL